MLTILEIGNSINDFSSYFSHVYHAYDKTNGGQEESCVLPGPQRQRGRRTCLIGLFSYLHFISGNKYFIGICAKPNCFQKQN